jgi:formylglycine-generating enzyme required for sulfatase activity
MLGNVKEWCSDFYGPYFSSAMTDPTGPAYGSYRILKGGSWFSSEGNCRPAYRADRADYPYSLVGFRIVCEQ